MTTILKLGGSVITEKDTRETVDSEALDDTARTIGNTDLDLVLVHGAGSFGHYYADKHGVNRTRGTHSHHAVREIHDSMERLNRSVLDTLADHDVRALPVHPISVGARTSEGELQLFTKQIRTMLGEEFVPVLYGDVITHEGRGGTIVSGDELVCLLAERLGADRVGLCSSVPGVLDDGTVIPEIHSFSEAESAVGASESTDVTGGMAGKVQALLSIGMPAFVFDREGLAPFLTGENPGTKIGCERC